MGKNGIGSGAEHRAADGGAAVNGTGRNLLTGRNLTAGGMPEDRRKIERGRAFQNFKIRRGALPAFENKNVAELDFFRRNVGFFFSAKHCNARHIGIYAVAVAGLCESRGI